MENLPVPTHEEASQWLGKLASLRLARYGMRHLDYTQVGLVADSKKGVDFAKSVAKLSQYVGDMNNFQVTILKRVSLYLADGGEPYADPVKFTLGLLGRVPYDPDAELTPNKLREIRQTLGLSQTDFGVYLGLDTDSPRTVQNWELGTRSIPSTITEILRLKGQL